MGLQDFFSALGDLLDTKLFVVGETTITLASALAGALVVLATFWISRVARRSARGIMRRRGIDNENTLGTVSGWLHYIILIVGFSVALQTWGIDLATLFAAGAIFAIGIGFAMQNIAENFVAGVILLAENSIRPGDILELENAVVRVTRMGIRATIVRTRDGEDLIVPNSLLVQSTVKNYTLQDSFYRLKTVVGVTYRSDMSLVRETLEEVVDQVEWRLPNPAPQVLMMEFGDNSVVFEIAVWMSNPWNVRLELSALNEAVWWALKEKGIEIAFPQLDVHFDDSFESSLARFRSAPSQT